MINIDLQNKLASLDEKQLSAIYMRVFNTDDGNLVLEDLRNRANFFLPTYEHEYQKVDPERVLINEGKRAIVISIESRLLPIVTPKDTDSQAYA